ncbi:MAG: hypothetical protein J5J06_05180 [Phycisphaerae bacterium]|nr:hypothetical protein [Phycisphaerae bacterium]
MAQERPGRIAEWSEIARQRAPVLRQHFRAWIAACQENPHMIWEAAPVRYATYALGAVVLLWSASWLTTAINPLPQEASERAVTADFHLLCTNPQCGYHFVIQRKFGFNDFPVTCPKCEQKTGHRARPCYSPACGGRWVVPHTDGRVERCPRCGQTFP